MNQPTLQTTRLTLRPMSLTDAPTIQRLAGDKAVAATTLSIPHPYEDGMAEQWIATHQTAWERNEQAVFAITLTESAQLIGAVGLILAAAHHRAELGYWVGQPYWGRGYTTEAAAAIVRFGFDHLKLNRIEAHHFTHNPASGRVMQKIGMQREGTFKQYVYHWDQPQDVIFYAILRSEYEAMRSKTL